MNKYRKQVEDAKIEHLNLINERMQPKIQNELSEQINKEWTGVLSLPDLKSSDFDYQVLKTLKSKL